MTTVQLEEYLKIVVDMEQNLYLQESVIHRLQQEAARLAEPKKLKVPEKRIVESPDTSHLKQGLRMIGLGALGVTIGWILVDISTDLDLLLGVLLSLLGLIGGPVCFVWGAILVFSSCVCYTFEGSKCKKRVEDAEKEYQSEKRRYDRETEAENQRIQKELPQKNLLMRELEAMQEAQKHSRETLRAVYDLGVIFPKYRNLIAVCSLYEYVSSRRCDRLEGADGAYNIFESEIRLDRIITSLDQISCQLNQIQRNQYMLYQSIQSVNNTCSRLLNANVYLTEELHRSNMNMEEFNRKLDNLVTNSSVGVYQRERIQAELEYMNRMDYMLGRNDGVFNNRPPFYNQY